jgi:murein DD-endopeptidase MepM/ murein hydrolase activator NlpD
LLRNRVYLALTVLLTLLMLAAVVLPAKASLVDDLQDELDDLQDQLEQEQGNLNQQRNREAALQQELEQLDRRLKALQAELARLSDEIFHTEHEINVAEADLAEAEAQLAAQEKLLGVRIRAIHERGSITYLEVLLSANTFSEFLTQLNNLKMVASNDLRLVEETQAVRDDIQLQKEALEDKKNGLEEMRRQALSTKAEFERTVATREQVLSELQAQIALNLKAIQNLEREAQELESLIRELLRDSEEFDGISGVLRWPMEPSYVISSGYGWRQDPFTGLTTWHGGIDIAPYYGAPNFILAAEYGRVIFSGWNGGYGNCVMIDHGGGTVTLYAHMSTLSVSVGQIVYRAQRIGRAGTTGYSTGVHLHFEVREYSKPPVRSYPNGQPDHRYNPMIYF